METVPFEERETTINVDYEKKIAHVYSSNPKTVNQLTGLIDDFEDAVSVDFINPFGMQITVPMNWIKIKPPNKVSQQNKEKAAERLSKVRHVPGQ